MKQDKIPGVLGGMGPEATVDFMSRLLRMSPAETDQDHLRLLIDHNPQTPNRHAAIAGKGPPVGPLLASMAAGFERAGAEVLIAGCTEIPLIIEPGDFTIPPAVFHGYPCPAHDRLRPGTTDASRLKRKMKLQVDIDQWPVKKPFRIAYHTFRRHPGCGAKAQRLVPQS